MNQENTQALQNLLQAQYTQKIQTPSVTPAAQVPSLTAQCEASISTMSQSFLFDPSVPSWRRWTLSVPYAPYLTGSIILVIAVGIFVGAFALMKPAAVVKGQELSWVRVVFWSLGFSLLVVGAAAVAHWLENKRYTAPIS